MSFFRQLLLVFVFLCLLTTGVHSFDASDAPEEVSIDSIKELYDGVVFDHLSHIDFADGRCAKCHHNTAGVPMSKKICVECHKKSVTEGDKLACGDCHKLHPFAAVHMKKKEFLLYHIDKPSLKAAYHLKCIGCHKEQGAPTGCTDCHEMTESGKRFFNTGPFAPAPKADHGKEHH